MRCAAIAAVSDPQPHVYDRIGIGYASMRRADERIARRIRAALGDAGSILNVGAGSGSYEPADRRVVAVEPSITMIRQRAADAAPVVQGCAERLPFATATFDAALAILTVHHWRDWRVGLREIRRVARERIVLFTWDPGSTGFWIHDYFPNVLAADRKRFPSLRSIQDEAGAARIEIVPIPHDCSDGFMGAWWRRPDCYLLPGVRQSISSLATASGDAGLARLAADLASDAWTRRYAGVLAHAELDLGYRLLIVGGS